MMLDGKGLMAAEEFDRLVANVPVRYSASVDPPAPYSMCPASKKTGVRPFFQSQETDTTARST